ncbi:WD40 repeat [Aphelenchoides avenae]|nr:WD40 repeat [Aphelenchus avenae]
MQFIPRHGRQANNDVFLLTSSDGKIHIVNGTGKIEKTVDAHEGAALSVRWSGDATSFLSCGEEGAVKMWSRSGMLRSVLAQNGRPVYAVDWNADGTKVIYCAGENCFIKSLKAQGLAQPGPGRDGPLNRAANFYLCRSVLPSLSVWNRVFQMNPTKWKAHEGVVLCLTWCASTDMIVTGGEDCRYRIWDGFGRPLYSSNSHNYPITSVAWNPDGELLAVGSFNILRLCDKAGWSHSLDKLNSGSIYSLCWSPDGTQLVAGCANGQVVHANVIEKRIYHNNLEAVQSKRKTIEIRDVLSDVARERLETRERITKIQLGFNHLVVATTKQIYVFSSRNWNTPVMVDLKESSAQLVIRLAEKFFLLIDGHRIEVRTYEGRVVSTIKLPGTAAGEAWTEKTAAIANDCVALVDRAQRNVVLMYDAQTASAVGNGKISHVVDVVELALNQCGTLTDRRVAYVDINSDCYLAVVNAYATLQKVEKLGSLVTNITFNNTTNMLAAFQDRKLVVWTVPSVVFTDKEMLPKTMIELETGEMGKSAFMIGRSFYFNFYFYPA